MPEKYREQHQRKEKERSISLQNNRESEKKFKVFQQAFKKLKEEAVCWGGRAEKRD